MPADTSPFDQAVAARAGAGAGAAWLAKIVEVGLTDADLTPPQFRLLTVLARSAERAKGVAIRLDVSPPSVTALVDGAVQRGLVSREQEEGDRRSVRHRLTPDGEAALEAGHRAIAEHLDRLSARLSPAQARRAMEGLELWWRALELAWEAES